MRQLKIIRQITSRDQISLDKYLMEIGRIEIIDADREAELARRAKAGDSEALEQLVSANLRFVVSVAKQYQHQGLALSDLINEGNLGLIKAAGRFDETRGFKFISYAVWWIRQSILQALADQGRVVRLPLNRVGLMSRISKLGSRMEQEMQRDVSDQEIAAMLEISSAEVGE
ncbi:MAG: RNA polymerase sigma factor RpoD/SigA, partial [Bacteroidota bacterium]